MNKLHINEPQLFDNCNRIGLTEGWTYSRLHTREGNTDGSSPSLQATDIALERGSFREHCRLSKCIARTVAVCCSAIEPSVTSQAKSFVAVQSKTHYLMKAGAKQIEREA